MRPQRTNMICPTCRSTMLRDIQNGKWRVYCPVCDEHQHPDRTEGF